MRTALVVLLGLLAGCGDTDLGDGARLPAGIEIRGLEAKDVGAIQLTVLNNATSYMCSPTCLVSRIKKPDGTFSDIVRIKGDDGKEKNALRMKLDGTKLLSADGQTLTLDMPTGTNRMIVAEILSADETKLLATGCAVLAQVNKGTNPAVTVRATVIDPAPTCDPRID